MIGTLSAKLENLPAESDAFRLDMEIKLLSAPIDNHPNPRSAESSVLCILYQTLMWARSPGGYAPPSSMVARYVEDVR